MHESQILEAKQAMTCQIVQSAQLCQCDVCEPIPIEIFILLGIGRKDLFEYCRMRIFKTLFSWNELEDCLREIVWPSLLHLE